MNEIAKILWFLSLVLLTCAQLEFKEMSQKNEVDETIDVLKQGEHLLQIDSDYKDIILLTGNNGTGKSALSRFVAGDLSELESIGDGPPYRIKYKYEGVISDLRTVSYTIYPERIIDETNVAFYDCPGYDDTRNSSIEITTTHFMKKVVDNAKSLKIILVVNYGYVIRGGSRNDFVTLVEHTRRFLKNLTNYEDSIALIATKVNNDYIRQNNTLVLLSDEQVIKSIASFLSEYRDRLKGETETEFNKYALSLVEILLKSSDNGKTYDKIGIFRTPDQEGTLDKIDLMVEGRRKVRDLIINRTTYGARSAEDIGYTISERSRLKLIEFANKFNVEIASKVEGVGNEIEEYFRAQEKQLGNLLSVTNRYQNAFSSISHIIDNVKDGTTYINSLIDTAIKLNVPVSPEYFAQISDYLHYITFLQEFTIDGLLFRVNDWNIGLKKCREYLEETRNWFKFLSEIYNRHSQYNFRVEITKYNVSNINDWGLEGKPQGIYIGDDDTFRIFAQKQKLSELVQNVIITGDRLKVLNNLLDITLKNTPTSTCETDNTKLVVKGDYIRMVDVNTTICSDKLETLHILALHTIFIDSDFDAFGKRINISIIAPKWYIHGKRKFDLSAMDNEYLYETAAKNSYTANVTGTTGLQGKPGYNGGNFLGISSHFVDSDKLEIISNGGKGSTGQNGGSGFNSSNPDYSRIGTGSQKGTEVFKNNYRLVEQGKHTSRTEVGGRMVTEYYDTYYTIHAECSTAAGNGGNGGFGGRPGFINIIELGDKSLIHKIAQKGLPGISGKKGSVSVNPQKVELLYKCKQVRSISTRTTASWKKVSISSDETCPSNEIATDGGNPENSTTEGAPQIYSQDISYPLNEFKTFARTNQKNGLERDGLINFVNLIDNSSEILANYSTKGFVNELLTLESQFYELQHIIDMKMYYLSLSDRVEKFVNILNSSPNLNSGQLKEQVKVFNYLYTASWSKYLTLNSHDALMVIDVEKYLTVVTDSIRNFKASARQTIIDDKRNEYRKSIDMKINEANRIIENNIRPEIKAISESIDDSLKSLVNATIAQRNQTEKDLEEYTKQQQKLGSQIGLRILFSCLGVVSQFGSVLGPIGTAVTGIAGAVSQIGSGFLDKTQKNRGNNITPGVKSALDVIDDGLKKKRKERTKALQKELEKYKKEAGEFKPLDDIVKKINELEKALKETLTTTAQADKKEKELLVLVAEKKKKYEEEQHSGEEKDIAKFLKGFNVGLQVFEKTIDVFKMFHENSEDMEEINDCIEKATQDLEDLKNYEREIYNTMWPMVNEMREKINNPNLSGDSGSILELKKWQIQSMIRETRVKIQKFVKGFAKQEEELVEIMEKLDEAFEILINVYDRIDTYYDQEKLGDFIATVVSSDFARIDVSDSELQSDLLRLDLYISANVVLGQYKSAIDAFEQAIFPFASMYSDFNRLPENLQLGNNTANLVEAAVRTLDRLQANINEYDKGVINKNDRYIVSAQFNDNLRSTRPFYTWKSDDLEKSMTALFAGKEILLSADIKNGVPWNAVKFNVVELLFKSKRQEELNEELSNFNIHLTHMGNNYYRCGGSFVVIDTESPELVYSYQKQNGVPVHRNVVYEKIQNGTIMLSPYTMWRLRLVPAVEELNAFSKLRLLAKNIDLVLIGRGRYVTNDAPICGNSLNNYYENDLTVSEIAYGNYYSTNASSNSN